MKTINEQAQEMRELLSHLVSRIDEAVNQANEESDKEYADNQLADELSSVAFRCDHLAYDYKYGQDILRPSER